MQGFWQKFLFLKIIYPNTHHNASVVWSAKLIKTGFVSLDPTKRDKKTNLKMSIKLVLWTDWPGDGQILKQVFMIFP